MSIGTFFCTIERERLELHVQTVYKTMLCCNKTALTVRMMESGFQSRLFLKKIEYYDAATSFGALAETFLRSLINIETLLHFVGQKIGRFPIGTCLLSSRDLTENLLRVKQNRMVFTLEIFALCLISVT